MGDTPIDDLVAAVQVAGLDGPESPDLLAVAPGDPDPGELHAVYSRRAVDELAALPRFDEASGLRRLADPFLATA